MLISCMQQQQQHNRSSDGLVLACLYAASCGEVVAPVLVIQVLLMSLLKCAVMAEAYVTSEASCRLQHRQQMHVLAVHLIKWCHYHSTLCRFRTARYPTVLQCKHKAWPDGIRRMGGCTTTYTP